MYIWRLKKRAKSQEMRIRNCRNILKIVKRTFEMDSELKCIEFKVDSPMMNSNHWKRFERKANSIRIDFKYIQFESFSEVHLK